MDDRITIDVGDILAVQVECADCHTTVSYPTERAKKKADPLADKKCPGCGRSWHSDTGPMPWIWQKLIETLTGLGEMEGKNVEEVPWLLRFQVKKT